MADEDVLAAGELCDLLLRWGETKVGSSCHDDRTARRAVPTELSSSAEIALRTYAQAKSNLAEAICRSENALRLLAIPELHDDVAFCLRPDVYNLVAVLGKDGSIRVAT
jgi:phosphosulfolactate phosphohydrolase-like enzyme